MNATATLRNVCLSAPFLITPMVEGATAVSNLSASDGVGHQIIGPLGNAAKAQSFSTASSGSWTLDSIFLQLREIGDANGNLSVAIFSEVAGSPGIELGVLTGSNPSGATNGDYEFTATAAITLGAATTYFVVLSAPEPDLSNRYEWQLTNSTSEAADPGWSIGDGSLFQGVNGAWNASSEALKLAVNVTPVPEPGIAVLAVLGAAGLIRRRRSIASR